MKNRLKRELMEWFKAFTIGIIIFVLVRAFIFSNYVVEGGSMKPTLHEGDKLVVNKIGYKMTNLHHFDVIVFHANKKEDYVKRIIGLPGDVIEYKDDRLYINGKKYDEPFLEQFRKQVAGGRLTGDFTLEEITGKKVVPEGKLFVLGDNRLGSWDSRHFGFVPQDSLVGKVNLRYWPLQDISISF